MDLQPTIVRGKKIVDLLVIDFHVRNADEKLPVWNLWFGMSNKLGHWKIIIRDAHTYGECYLSLAKNRFCWNSMLRDIKSSTKNTELPFGCD